MASEEMNFERRDFLKSLNSIKDEPYIPPENLGSGQSRIKMAEKRNLLPKERLDWLGSRCSRSHAIIVGYKLDQNRLNMIKKREVLIILRKLLKERKC